jgi:hypothetical protein
MSAIYSASALLSNYGRTIIVSQALILNCPSASIHTHTTVHYTTASQGIPSVASRCVALLNEFCQTNWHRRCSCMSCKCVLHSSAC